MSNDVDNNFALLCTSFVSTDKQESIADLPNLMGVVAFGEKQSTSTFSQRIPYLSIGIESQGSDYFCEVWQSNSDVEYITIDDFSFSIDKDNLFGCVSFSDEVDGKKLETITQDYYQKLFTHIADLGYPYLFRMWNYIPKINDESTGLERYRAFCLGRNCAFERRFDGAVGSLPAATGIAKNSTGSVDIYFLAHRKPSMIHLENPRQTPAYRYPQIYGPKPPSFARATYLQRSEYEWEIYVSGTASIIGSKSMYSNDPVKQCQLALENIEIVIGNENLSRYDIKQTVLLTDLNMIKIYYRRSEDLPLIRECCERVLSDQAEKVYIHVDICRSDLLVEIEGCVASREVVSRCVE